MGAFSGVFDRYQARVIWLLPMLALYAAAYWRQTLKRPPLR
jgi:hypothetical protein